MKNIFLYILIFVTLTLTAQTKKAGSPVASKKQGSCTLTKTEKDPRCPGDVARVQITFIGASNSPVKRGVMMVINHDSLMPPLDAHGTYTFEVDPGKFKFQFSVPYWYRIKSETFLLQPKTLTSIRVKFEAVEMGSR